MKYWRGYLVAGIMAVCSWALCLFAATHSQLVDMVYPYISRIVMDYFAGWSADISVCLWQTLLLFGIVLGLGSLVLMFILRWNPIQLGGWILAVIMTVNLLGTGVYGLNEFSGPLAEDIRLDVKEYSIATLERAAFYYRDMVNLYSGKVDRNADGSVRFPEFEKLADQAGDGFQYLTYERYFSVFSGSTEPVKQLGMSSFYEGVTGMTVGLTGESAVNPDLPAVGVPFAICHEMAHRMCIYQDSDANFSAFLACTSNTSDEFRYSGYLMAFRACYNALNQINSSSSRNIVNRLCSQLDDDVMDDLAAYDSFFGEDGELPDDEFCKMLVSWHSQEFPLAEDEEDENKFDPQDENDERLQDILYPTQPEGVTP